MAGKMIVAGNRVEAKIFRDGADVGAGNDDDTDDTDDDDDTDDNDDTNDMEVPPEVYCAGLQADFLPGKFCRGLGRDLMPTVVRKIFNGLP